MGCSGSCNLHLFCVHASRLIVFSAGGEQFVGTLLKLWFQAMKRNQQQMARGLGFRIKYTDNVQLQ